MTHYEALGVDPATATRDLHQAYVALARRHHPDVAGGDADRMRAINEAWAVLGDPVRRARYDRELQRLPGTSPVAPAPAWVDDEPLDDEAELRADLADDRPIGDIVVLPRWLSLVPVGAFATAVGTFCAGLVMAMPSLLAFSVMAFLLSCVLFLAAPFMALFASRRGNRRARYDGSG